MIKPSRSGMHMAVQLSLVMFVAATLLADAVPADAGRAFVRAELPEGETVLAAAWSSPAELICVVTSSSGFLVRRIQAPDGAVSVVQIPKSLGQLKPGGGVILALAPAGTGLALIEKSSSILRPARLRVYSISGSQCSEVHAAAVPKDLWPQSVCWNTAGTGLYVTAQEYVIPEQLYSIGRLDMVSGRFQGAVPRSSFDLIDEVEFAPVRNCLLLRCRGYRGEYPESPIVGLIDLTNMQSQLLHAEAKDLRINCLANGHALLISDSRKSESWLLQSGSQRLERASFASAVDMDTLQATADGNWYGYLAGANDLKLQGERNRQYLGLRNNRSGQVTAWAEPVRQFVFAPDSSAVAAVSDDGRSMILIPLSE